MIIFLMEIELMEIEDNTGERYKNHFTDIE